MSLKLKRPLAFFDLETTGTQIGTDRIVEISVIKMHPDGTEEVNTWKINPEIPIPLENSMVHGIYDEHIKDAPVFKAVAKDIAAFIGESDLAGYNSNRFDIPMLMEEFLRVECDFDLDNRHFVDVQNIFHQMEQRTLRAAYQFYCGKDIVNAHSAEADTRATMEVLIAQIARYEGTEWEDKKGNKLMPVINDVEALHQFTNLNRPVDFAGRMVYNEEGEETFNFGKHKGKKVEDIFRVEPSYYSWMMNGDFPLYTKQKLTHIYKRFNEKREQAKPEPKPAPVKTEAPKLATPEKEPETVAELKTPKPVVDRPYFKKPNQAGNNKPAYIPRKENDPKEEAKPIDEDMLALLKQKFGK